MKLVAPDAARLSLPMLLYRYDQPAQDQVFAGWLFEDGWPCFNYIWPADYLKLDKDFKRPEYEVWDLDVLLKNLERHPDDLKSELKGRRIFIGDFRESSASHSAAMPDIFILANTYLTLTAGQHHIGLLWILLTLIVFAVLAYYSSYESLPKITLPKWFPLSTLLNKYIQEWISYAIAMFLWSLITIFFFGISVNVIAAATIFSLINYFKFKKYAEA